jgi:hypothetical protein
MRQRRWWVIVLIWVAVVAALVVVGSLAGPLTDADEASAEGSGYVIAGYVVLIGGAVVTGIYLVLTSSKQPLAPLRTCPSCGAKMQADLRLCPACDVESQPWVRHHDRWWFRSPSGWQWMDEAGTWRWYRDGTPSSGTTTDMTPNLAIDPARVEPPSDSDAHGPSPSVGSS